MPISLGAVYLVEKSPTVDFREGLFHLSFEIGGNSKFEVVMRPKTYAKMRMLGGEACAKWLLDDAPSEKVTPIRRKR